MKTKISLKLEKSLLEAANNYAAERGISVSVLIEEYFRTLKSQHSSPEDDEIPPLTASLVGILKGSWPG